MNPSTLDSTLVQLTTDIAAPPPVVYRFFIDSARFTQWMGPGAQLAADGTFAIHYPDGSVALGEPIEQIADALIRWRWGYQGADGAAPSHWSEVEIALASTPTGTAVTLRHRGLPTAEQRMGHTIGWTAWLAQLAQQGAVVHLAEVLPRLIDAWTAAWNASDPGEREESLAIACTPDCSFLDPFAQLASRDAIGMHIMGVQMYQPGVTLLVSGPPQQTHQWVRWSWEGQMPNGQTIATGHNVAEVASSGQLGRVLGFWSMP